MSDVSLVNEQKIRAELLDSSVASLESQVGTHHFAAGPMGRPGDDVANFGHIVNCGGTTNIIPRDNDGPSFGRIVNCGGTSIVLPRDNTLPAALTS